MILLFFMLSTIALSASEFEIPNITLSCKADGPTQVVIVTTQMIKQTRNDMQNCGVYINCSNGYNSPYGHCDLQRYTWKFEIPTDEIYCSARAYFVNYYDSSKLHWSYGHCKFPDPAPTVTVSAIGNQIVGSSLSLECNVTVVNGVNGSVDIIWMKDDDKKAMENNTKGYPGSKLTLYTSRYNISLLQMIDNDTTYCCQAVINTSPSVNNSDNFTLNVTIPPPNVTVSVLKNQILGSPLSLRCHVTTVKGIDSNLSIVWMKGDKEITRINNANQISNGTLMAYPSIYNISLLRMIDNDTTYYCQAVINTSPSLNNSDNYTLNVIIPPPNVTVSVLENQILGSPLSLRCHVTTVKGIDSNLSIVWMKGDEEILRINNANQINNGTLMAYSSIYNISLLRMIDNDTTYYCQAVINTSPSVNSSDNYTLNVVGNLDENETTEFRPDSYSQVALILAVVVTVFVLIAASILLSLFAYHKQRKLHGSSQKLTTNGQDEWMRSSISFADTCVYSVIGKDQPSTCEYIEITNGRVASWIGNMELLKIDEECKSLSSDYTTKEGMLNLIQGFSETDNESQHVASDSESNGKDDKDSYVFESDFNCSKDEGYITSLNETNALWPCEKPDDDHSTIVQQDSMPYFIHKNDIHENSVPHVQNITSVNSTSQNNIVTDEAYVKIDSDVQHKEDIAKDTTIQSHVNNLTDYGQELLMEATFPMIRTTSFTGHEGDSLESLAIKDDYFPHSIVVGQTSLITTTAIEGDYMDNDTVIQHSVEPNFQMPSQSMPYVTLQDSKDESFDNSNHNISATPRVHENDTDQEITFPTKAFSTDDNYSTKGGQYIDPYTAIHQGYGKSVHLCEVEIPCTEMLATSK